MGPGGRVWMLTVAARDAVWGETVEGLFGRQACLAGRHVWQAGMFGRQACLASRHVVV